MRSDADQSLETMCNSPAVRLLPTETRDYDSDAGRMKDLQGFVNKIELSFPKELLVLTSEADTLHETQDP